MLSGAVAAGKSFLGCWKGFLLNLKYPGNRGLICRKEASSLKGSTIKTLLEKVIPPSMIIGYNRQEGVLTHKTGIPGINSSIVFCGLDKRADQTYPTKIGSTEYGWIFVDEGTELQAGDWQMLMTRIRYSIPTFKKEQNDIIPKQLFTATNPDGPHHFLYKFFFESKDKDREVILTTPYDNPYLPKDYIKSLEQSLTGITKERLLFGKWVQAEGIIYKSFDFNKHICDKSALLPIKDYKALYFGADSNFPLPRGAVLAGIRGDGTIDIIDEYYQENAHVEDMIKWLVDWQKQRDWTVYGFHDPSDPLAIDKLNRTQGISVDKADNKIIPGISEVSRYFDNNLIRINKTCTNLIKELQSYRWKNKGEGEAPLKENDHLCDSLRYLLQSIREIPSLKVYGAKIFK
jgi:PBSX family phage terminase large subunit